MSGLKQGAFTGNREQGNPYEGLLDKGIAYDSYEANTVSIEHDGSHSVFLNIYRQGARRLLKHLQPTKSSKILDIGSGTGISTLETLLRNPSSSVIGVEMSEGMRLVAQYKFHQWEGEQLLQKVGDERLLQYWRDFRDETRQLAEKVDFVLSNFQDIECIGPATVDCAVGNQVMHWMELPKAFGQVHRLLRNGGEFLWNSASHFYEDQHFPSQEYGFRYNDFLRFVLDELGRNFSVGNLDGLSRPEHNLSSIQKVSLEKGLVTQQLTTYLLPVDLQGFVQNHVPIIAKQLITTDVDTEEVATRIREAIAKAINTASALRDIKHKYDIVPVFKSVKV